MCGRHATLRARDCRGRSRRWPGAPAKRMYVRFMEIPRNVSGLGFRACIGPRPAKTPARRTTFPRPAPQTPRSLRLHPLASIQLVRIRPPARLRLLGRICCPIPLGGRVIRARPLFWVRLRGLVKQSLCGVGLLPGYAASCATNSSQFAASPARSLPDCAKVRPRKRGAQNGTMGHDRGQRRLAARRACSAEDFLSQLFTSFDQ